MFQLVALMLLTQQALQPVSQGVASYYTVASCGKVTASGDKLDDARYTCALPKGEFGSYYLVVAENGSSVVCKLNDRGPHVKGRVIDLSKAAMRRLHTTAGTVRVQVYKIETDALASMFGNG